jgi:quinol monooxygenase YgiN
MIVEYIRYTVAGSERGAELVSAYEIAAKALDASSECLGYDLTVCEEDPTSYILRIEWQSIQEHLNGFRKSPQFPPFFQAIGGFVKEITEMQHYHLTPVRSSQS